MKVWENLKKLWKLVLACPRLLFPQHFLFSQFSTCVSIKQLDCEPKRMQKEKT